MRVYACGNCGGALEIEESASAICHYCGFTNEIENLQSDFENFRNEVTSWLSNLGVARGSGMDTTMRQLYFRDQIYPSLCTEFSNLIGDTEDILDMPVVYLPIYSKIPELVIRTSWAPIQGKPMKEFARKLENEELVNFAADPESQFLIQELKLRSLMTPMLMDVKELNSHPSAENFTRASNTLNYLANQIQPIINLPTQDEPSKDRQSYYMLLEKRIRLGAEALEKYAQAIRDRDLKEEEWCQATTDLVGSIRNSLKELTHLPIIDRVLLDTGLENDSSALSAGYNLTSLYTKITTVPYELYLTLIIK